MRRFLNWAREVNWLAVIAVVLLLPAAAGIVVGLIVGSALPVVAGMAIGILSVTLALLAGIR